jgi:hypothetical protein
MVDVVKAIQDYVAKMVSNGNAKGRRKENRKSSSVSPTNLSQPHHTVPGMKVLLLDAETVSVKRENKTDSTLTETFSR